jgi:hypothetical protein
MVLVVMVVAAPAAMVRAAVTAAMAVLVKAVPHWRDRQAVARLTAAARLRATVRVVVTVALAVMPKATPVLAAVLRVDPATRARSARARVAVQPAVAEMPAVLAREHTLRRAVPRLTRAARVQAVRARRHPVMALEPAELAALRLTPPAPVDQALRAVLAATRPTATRPRARP